MTSGLRNETHMHLNSNHPTKRFTHIHIFQSSRRNDNDIMSAQPSLKQAYETAGNPTDKSSREQSQSQLNAKTDDDNAV